MFGGWASRWLGDTWRLNAAAIIGPPYACTGMLPTIGAVFGTTEIEISGLRFREGTIQVRFLSHGYCACIVNFREACLIPSCG